MQIEVRVWLSWDDAGKPCLTARLALPSGHVIYPFNGARINEAPFEGGVREFVTTVEVPVK